MNCILFISNCNANFEYYIQFSENKLDRTLSSWNTCWRKDTNDYIETKSKLMTENCSWRSCVFYATLSFRTDYACFQQPKKKTNH